METVPVRAIEELIHRRGIREIDFDPEWDAGTGCFTYAVTVRFEGDAAWFKTPEPNSRLVLIKKISDGNNIVIFQKYNGIDTIVFYSVPSRIYALFEVVFNKPISADDIRTAVDNPAFIYPLRNVV